jgi:hypothetical protein
MKKKSSVPLKNHFEKVLKAFWKNFGKPKKRKVDKRANKITGDWRKNVMWLRDGLYQSDVLVPEYLSKIQLVNWTEGIAFELKTDGSRTNPTNNLGKSAFKINMFNRCSEFKIQMLVFITTKLNASRLKTCRYAKDCVKDCAEAGFEIEIIGV